MFIELKPPLRDITDSEKAFMILTSSVIGPNVSGFDHSIMAMYTVPNTSKISEDQSTKRVANVQ